jgi:hypothetical protein
VGLLFNYYFSIKWGALAHNNYAELILFGLVGLVGLLLNELFMWLFVSLVHSQNLIHLRIRSFGDYRIS